MTSTFVREKSFLSYELTVVALCVVALHPRELKRKRKRKNGKRNNGQLKTQKERQL
jgi:hypothetical protein